MINDQYEPSSEHEERVMELLEAEGRMTPSEISEALDVHKGALNHYLRRLTAAGWLDQPYGPRGSYEFVADPREVESEELAEMYRSHADSLVRSEGDESS